MGYCFRITDVRIGFLFLAIYALVSGICNTYLPSMLTTLEKRFDLTSSQIGWLMGSNDIGYLSCVVIIAYYGSRGNQSLMLCMSSVGLSLSGFLFALPYLIYGPKYTADELLSMGLNQNNATNDDSMGALCRTNISTLIQGEDPVKEILRNRVSENTVSFVIQMIGGVVSGIAACPFWNIGLSMVDDMAGEKSGIFIGALFTTRSISPIIGFLFGAWINTQHETMEITHKEYAGGQRDPKWIGAWWLGYLILAGCVLITAPFLLALKVLDKTESREDIPEKVALKETQKNGGKRSSVKSNNDDDMQFEKIDLSQFSLKELLSIIRRLWTNPIYVFMMVGMFFEIFSFVGIYSFFTKYLEYHFRLMASHTNIVTAFALAGSSVVATMLSGLVSNFFKMSMRGMNLFHAVVNTVSALLFAFLFIFSCPTTNIIGFNMNEGGLAGECTTACNCPMEKYSPVCDQSNTYFSPCQAGCSKFFNQSMYGDCSCVNGTSSTAIRGACEGVCPYIYPYIAVFIVVKIIGALASVQFTQIMMRLCDKRNKPVSLATIGFVFAIFGLSLPPTSGAIIDTVCLLKNTRDDGAKSFCLLYDTKSLHFLLHGYCFAAQLPGCLAYFISWWKTPKDKPKPNRETKNTEEGHEDEDVPPDTADTALDESIHSVHSIRGMQM